MDTKKRLNSICSVMRRCPKAFTTKSATVFRGDDKAKNEYTGVISTQVDIGKIQLYTTAYIVDECEAFMPDCVEAAFCFDSKDLVPMFKYLSGFTDSESVRFALGSILVEVGEHVTVVASDGRKLVWATIDDIPCTRLVDEESVSGLVPPRMLTNFPAGRTILGLCNYLDQQNQVKEHVFNIAINGNGDALACRYDKGARFPKWREVIPKDMPPIKIQWDAKKLLTAVQTLKKSMSKSDSKYHIYFEVANNKARLTSATGYYIDLPCGCQPNLRFALSPEHLLPIARWTQSLETRHYSTDNENRSKVFAGKSTIKGREANFLVMPMAVDEPPPQTYKAD